MVIPGRGDTPSCCRVTGKKKEMCGGRRLTTNNRMEIQAVIAGLEALIRPCRVTVYSDSQY